MTACNHAPPRSGPSPRIDDDAMLDLHGSALHLRRSARVAGCTAISRRSVQTAKRNRHNLAKLRGSTVACRLKNEMHEADGFGRKIPMLNSHAVDGNLDGRIRRGVRTDVPEIVRVMRRACVR